MGVGGGKKEERVGDSWREWEGGGVSEERGESVGGTVMHELLTYRLEYITCE